MNFSIVALQALGAAASIGLMFVVNTHQRPTVDEQYDEREYVNIGGTLSFNRTGESTEVSLMPIHVLTRDIQRGGRTLRVRELMLRAAVPRGEPAPVEVYVDVAPVGDIAAQLRDPQRLAQTELPVLPTGRLGTRQSFVTLDGEQPRRVITGSLLLTEVVPAQGAYKASGRVELQVDTGHGIELISGRVEGQISWDATGA